MSRTYDPGTTLLLLGTKRGLFLLSSADREQWSVDCHALDGTPVYNAMFDPRSGRILAADNNVWWGVTLRYSDDFGETWEEPRQGIQFPEDSGQKLKAIWVFEPGREEGTVYAGVDPASLWISKDNGETWEAQQGLLQHPTRERWNPGAGGLCLHSIVPDYSDSDRMWIGISAVGCMRTEDGGKTWTHANRNTRAGFLPDPYPEYGQCIHRLLQHPQEPDVLYQQNHCGVYKSVDGGDNWIDIQGAIPSEFGFAMALDRNDPNTVFTVPLHPMARHNLGDQFAVYRSQDGGQSWEARTDGLPAGAGVRLGVLRHGMCSDAADPCGVYVGTNTGQLFATRDAGDSWQIIGDFLPSIYSVTVATV